MVTILDGPVGTELLLRGVPTPPPWWSAAALESAPGVLAAIHADYRRAGAQVHTANTFRTQARTVGPDWRRLTDLAVASCRRHGAAEGGRVAGSLAPLEDCYRPDLSPSNPRPEHRRMAQALAASGCDLLLVETFPHVGEALVATEEALRTGLPVWVSFTAGPDADLLRPAEVRAGAQEAVRLGAAAVLVNCVPATRTLPYLHALADLGVPFGAYANAGAADEALGWAGHHDDPDAAERYADLAEGWVAAGASLLGSCCGTGPRTIRALHARFADPVPSPGAVT